MELILKENKSFREEFLKYIVDNEKFYLLEIFELSEIIKRKIEYFFERKHLINISPIYKKTLCANNTLEYFQIINSLYQDSHSIYNILFKSSILDLTNEQYNIWLNGNLLLIIKYFRANKNNVYSLENYYIKCKLDDYVKIKPLIDQTKFVLEYKPQVKPLCHQKIQQDVVSQKPKFLININESKNCITFSNSECSYTLNIFNSGHYHFLLDNNLIYLITDYSGLLLYDHLETSIIKKLKEEVESYVTKYNYNIYILNKEIYRNVAYQMM